MKHDNDEDNAAEREAIQAADTETRPMGPSPLVGITGAALAEAPPPIKWLCKDLQLAPGRPFLVAGYGGAGKTWIVMDVALAFASGSRALDSFDVGQGPVAHLNFEMSHWEALRRYQRVAFGRALDIATVPVHLLSQKQLEGFNLRAVNAAAKLIATLKPIGPDGLAIVDSFRASVPGLDENSSAVRAPLDTLLEVSESTGWAFVVVHHEGKPPSDGGGREAVHRMRGSSAINDALDTSWSIVTGGASGIWRLEQGKASTGAKVGPYFVRLIDVGEIDPSSGKSVGVRFEWIPEEQAGEAAAIDGAAKVRPGILAALAKSPLTSNDITRGSDHVAGRGDTKRVALEQLRVEGLIAKVEGRWTLVERED